MTHYLITGGAGFIGSHLAEALLARGDRVTVIDDLSTGRFDNIAPLAGRPGFRFAIDTITNEVVMDRLVSECDVVVHLAAAVGVELIIRDPVRVIETNILGTHAVLKVANRYRKRVLIASTSEIYGKGVRVPFAEDDDRVLGPTTTARWSYSTSKAVDEFLALAYHKQMGLPVVVFRLFNTVGPRQTGRYGMVVPRFVEQALAGQPLGVYGDGTQARCFLHVADAVRAIIALAGCPEATGEVFNVGSTEEVSILDLARRVVAAAGGVAGADTIRLIPYNEAYGPGFEDMHRRVPDVRKIERYTGWRPERSLDEILADVIAYFKMKSP
ncbi:MAG: GDP-mannose 4,6-dehydratase [Anaerolineae bacterium]|nr:GDP-mannose 4,6-dehydratase [Anaerolineae bacterium]